MQTEGAFEAFVGSFISDVKTQYLRDEVNGYSDDIGERVRTWLPNEFTLLEVGLEWCFERIQWWSSQYSFVRTLFKRDVNFEQLGELLPQLSKDEFKSNNPVVNGARQVAWYIYHKCLDASSQRPISATKSFTRKKSTQQEKFGIVRFGEQYAHASRSI